MSDDSEKMLTNNAKELWHDVKSAVENVFDREITSQEFYYLLSLYPYLEICDADYPYLDEGTVPKVINLKNGWQVFDFGSVLCASRYELFCRPIAAPLQEEGEGGKQGGDGTIVKQYSDAAFEMIQLAIQKGWSAAEIVSGFYPMQRIAWIAANEKNYSLKGFEPTPEDYVVQSWVTRIREGKLYPPSKPFMKGMEKTPKR